jgi:hypothetical protein
VTHSVANLDVCDRLLVLAPGGKVAYYGPPKEALAFLGFTDWADVFQAFEDPRRDWARHYGTSPAFRTYVAAGMQTPPAAAMGPGGMVARPPKNQSWIEQLSTLVRRYCRTIVSDKLFLGLTIALPIIMGLIAKVLPSGNLLTKMPGRDGDVADVMLILCIGAYLAGAANAVRELIKERAIYQRERAVGLSRSAYIASKLLVLGVIAAIQGVVLTLVATVGTKLADKGVFTAPLIELMAAAALLSITAMVVGLFISAVVKSSEMAMPLLVLTTLAQIVFAGALVALNGKVVLDQLSWIMPARWGLSAMAGTLNAAFLMPRSPDPLWKMTLSQWSMNMGMLVVLCLVLTVGVSFMLRRHEPEVMRKR